VATSPTVAPLGAGYLEQGLRAALAGLLQCVFALADVGRALKYVTYPVVAGLMLGVAILMSQISLKPLFGMSAAAPWSAFDETWHPLSLVVTLATLLIAFKASCLSTRIPAVVLALVGSSLLPHLLAALYGAEHLGTTTGGAAGLLPAHSLRQTMGDGNSAMLAHWLPSLLPYALAIAAFSSLSSLLALSTVESAKGERGKGDRELINQGLVNVCAGVLEPHRVSATFLARRSISRREDGARFQAPVIR
jgi:MFS superfamily sulfate permease-like transporter